MTTPSDPDPSLPSKESISKATSELNNLLQIISGTSALMESKDQNPGSKEYMEMLRLSIERAEKVAADLAGQAGGATEKVTMHPELAAFMRNRKEPENTGPMKQSIMLVDDEQMALTLVKRVLTEAGFSVVTAQSGFECIDQFRRKPFMFQLVLLDLTMPFMDGEETFQRLREIRDDIPVLLCTGFIQEDRLKRLIGAGLTGFLRKPIAPAEIVGTVRATLQSVKYSQGDVHGSKNVSIVV